MQLAARYGSLHHAVKRPLLSRATRHAAPCTVFSRNESQLVPPTELSASPNPKAHDIAILGGGITGLATAFHLQRTIPHANISIYEQQKRIGGWLDSEVIEVDDGEVLFEWGARSLRPDMGGSGLATAMLLVQLGITDRALCITKTAPAALNRYVYYPDHLVRMPGPSSKGGRISNMFRTIYAAFTEPLFKGVFSAMLSEPAVAPRQAHISDESIGDFIRRRFGPQIADNLVSAVLHGIYAGDLYKLSARTLLPSLWYAERRDPEGNGILAEYTDLFFKNHVLRSYKDVEFRNLSVTAKDFPRDNPLIDGFLNTFGKAVSVYTFAHGLGFLGQQLRQALEDSNRVKFITSARVEGTQFDNETKKISVKASGEGSANDSTFDYVVSSLSPGQMKDCMGETGETFDRAVEQVNDAASVMVVNLYYSNPNLIPSSHAGFGYLIPRSIPVDQNPERALGVIFGSETAGARGKDAIGPMPEASEESLEAQKERLDAFRAFIADERNPKEVRDMMSGGIEEIQKSYDEQLKQSKEPQKEIRWGQDTAPGTKLTVMMGGHWWKGWEKSDLPSEAEGIEMAKAVLARHLRIQDSPKIAKARLNMYCIPQYPVGYRERMATIHEGLMKKFEGRMKVAGPWWQGGVGVNDCTRKARLAALSIREQWDDKTGLEEYTEDEKWVLMDRRTGRVFMDPMQKSQ